MLIKTDFGVFNKKIQHMKLNVFIIKDKLFLINLRLLVFVTSFFMFVNTRLYVTSRHNIIIMSPMYTTIVYTDSFIFFCQINQEIFHK